MSVTSINAMETSMLPLPPSLAGAPVVGNALQMMRDPLATLERGRRELGNIFSLKLGPQRAVILLGPENSEEFFGIFRDFSGGMEPILPLWLPLPRLLRSRVARRKVHALLQGLIDRRRREPMEPKDFLQLLVEMKYSDGSAPPDQVLIDLIL